MCESFVLCLSWSSHKFRSPRISWSKRQLWEDSSSVGRGYVCCASFLLDSTVTHRSVVCQDILTHKHNVMRGYTQRLIIYVMNKPFQIKLILSVIGFIHHTKENQLTESDPSSYQDFLSQWKVFRGVLADIFTFTGLMQEKARLIISCLEWTKKIYYGYNYASVIYNTNLFIMTTMVLNCSLFALDTVSYKSNS
jgi:hypothetical protein